MAFAKDYVDVATRIREFKAEYPTGSLQQVRVEFHTINFTTSLGYSNTVENAASIALIGNLSLDVETLHFYDADADDWASRISLGLPERRVQNIESPVLLRSGQVNENLLRDPFDIAQVTANNSKIVIDDKYYITRVTHQISPTSWDASFDLWKGQ